MLPHILGQSSHADTGKVIDRKSCVFRVVHREYALIILPEHVILQTTLQRLHAQLF